MAQGKAGLKNMFVCSYATLPNISFSKQNWVGNSLFLLQNSTIFVFFMQIYVLLEKKSLTYLPIRFFMVM
jgi:hypothetical protein